MRGIRPVAVLIVAAVTVMGCGSEDDRVKLTPITGTVTLNGKPLAEAFISFIPDPTNKVLTPGTDSTGPEGSYKIMWKQRSGVAPGKYRVIVSPPLPRPAGHLAETFKDDPYMADLMSEGLSAPNTKKKPPFTRSEFENVEVGPEGDPLDFDVKGKSTGHSKS